MSVLVERARPFVAAGLLSSSDLHAVGLCAPRFGEARADVLLALAFAARAPRIGAAGIDLRRLPEHVGDELELRGRSALRVQEEVDQGASEVDDANAPEASSSDASSALPWPVDRERWLEDTLASPMVGGPDDVTPFVRQDLAPIDRSVARAPSHVLLLTRRMFEEQRRLARAIALRASARADEHELRALDAILARVFPRSEGRGPTEAERAVRCAAKRRLSIVTGGPGTGKTYSVSRLLAVLLEAQEGSRALGIELAAPTGKAAVRMSEALREATDRKAKHPIAASEATLARLAKLSGTTLHRLLGIRPDGSMRAGPDRPIDADVVVVDEVSMIDLVLMRRLLTSVAPKTRLVLLGDPDQLASVEAGSVLADLLRASSRHESSRHESSRHESSHRGSIHDANDANDSNDSNALGDSLVRFTFSHRFASAPDVALVASCLQTSSPTRDLDASGRLAQAVDRLVGRGEPAPGERYPLTSDARAEGRPTRLEWLGGPDRSGKRPRPTEAQLDALAAPYVSGLFDLGEAPPTNGGAPPTLDGYVSLLLGHVDRERPGRFLPSLLEPRSQRALLDALDHYRVLAVHRSGPLGVEGLDRALAERVRATLREGGLDASGTHWVGRPILVTENAYDVDLRNGDVGLVLPTRSGRAVVFPASGESLVRAVPLARLPSHEGALAMTVHKSQGSQFTRVALVLAGSRSPLQTRELVYTGVTRARQQLVWLGDADELTSALERTVERASGLAELVADELSQASSARSA
jgi:exodeoxyribonuclease V alpha subunit